MSNINNTFLGVLTGNDFFTAPNSVKAAVAERAKILIPKIERKDDKDHPAGWGYLYDGNRCKPENLGWRFEQYYGSPDPQEILDGKWDEEVEWTYHEAADSEWYYRYEKDWG